MSYVVSIIRPIQKREFINLLDANPKFRIESQNDDCAVVRWSDGNESAMFVLSQGSIVVTSPSDTAFKQMQELAKKLNAEIIGEEEKFIIPQRPLRRGVFAGRATWIGWPILVIVLTILLIWRW
jgi:hypothetical protein